MLTRPLKLMRLVLVVFALAISPRVTGDGGDVRRQQTGCVDPDCQKADAMLHSGEIDDLDPLQALSSPAAPTCAIAIRRSCPRSPS